MAILDYNIYKKLQGIVYMSYYISSCVSQMFVIYLKIHLDTLITV